MCACVRAPRYILNIILPRVSPRAAIRCRFGDLFDVFRVQRFFFRSFLAPSTIADHLQLLVLRFPDSHERLPTRPYDEHDRKRYH